MAVGEGTVTLPATGEVISLHTIDEIDGVTVSERKIERVLLGYLTAAGKFQTISPTSGLPMEGVVSFAGTQRIGYVGGFLETIRPVTTVNTTPYTAGDTLCGEITLTNAMATPGGSGVLLDMNLTRESGDAFAFRVEVFDSNPTSTSTINTTFAWGSGDKGRWLGEIVVAADDERWSLIDSDSVINIRGINMGVDNAEATNHLYAHIITDEAITLAVGDISTAFKFIQN